MSKLIANVYYSAISVELRENILLYRNYNHNVNANNDTLSVLVTKFNNHSTTMHASLCV